MQITVSCEQLYKPMDDSNFKLVHIPVEVKLYKNSEHMLEIYLSTLNKVQLSKGCYFLMFGHQHRAQSAIYFCFFNIYMLRSVGY
jgi:hypothetical protein